MGLAFVFLPCSCGCREKKSPPPARPSDIPSVVTVPEKTLKTTKKSQTHREREQLLDAPQALPSLPGRAAALGPSRAGSGVNLGGDRREKGGLTYFVLCKPLHDGSKVFF